MTTVGAPATEVIDEIVEEFLSRRPQLGSVRLLLIDGRTGSGKTTLATPLSASLAAPIVHLEYLYPGWDGLREGVLLAEETVLRPFRLGASATIPQFDWYAYDWGNPLLLDAPKHLIIEGVGAATPPLIDAASLSLWIEVEDQERLARARRRDWVTFEDQWGNWEGQETDLLAQHDPRNVVDFVLDDTFSIVRKGQAQ